MRTRNSILNFIVSFFPWILLAIVGFLKIKLFIGNFGSELNGLVQLTGQIFTYFGIAELGFASAIAFKFYKLFATDDKKKISQLFCGSLKIFRKIGLIVVGLGVVLSFVGPLFIQSETLTKTYIGTVFLLSSVDYIFLYFFQMPYQTILIADQKKYKVNLIINIKTIAFKLIELFLIYLKIDYLLILSLGIVFNAISTLLIVRCTNKNYPWLNKKEKPDTSVKTLTKDVFFHKIFKVIFDNTDSILLSVFKGGLLNVSIYGAYHYIVSYLRQILDYVLNSPLESFGNLFASNDTKHKQKESIYNEFFSVAMIVAIFMVSLFFISAQKFVVIWLGNDYLINTLSVSFFSAILFYDCLLKPVSIISDANGKYKETKKYVLIGAIINLVLSIILVKEYKIAGILFATLLSQAVAITPGYVKYIYNNVLKIKQWQYYKKFAFSAFVTVVLIFFNKFLINTFTLYSVASFSSWILSSAMLGVINAIILFTLFYLLFPSFKLFLKRLKKLRSNK